MINSVALTGRLTKNPELRYTQSGKPVANFTLAVERNFKDQNGEKLTDFINCVIWDKQAEALANYTKKGSLIGVVGEINTRSYENNNGERVFVTEVRVNNFTFLESKKNEQSAQSDPFANNQSNNPADNITNNDLPF